MDYNETVDDLSTRVSSINNDSKVIEINKLLDDLKTVRQWKGVCKTFEIIKEIKNKPFIINKHFVGLVENKAIMPVEERCKALKFGLNDYYSQMKDDLGLLLAKLCEKKEILVSSKWEVLKSLQSGERIGMYGQRLPKLFEDVEKVYVGASRGPELKALIEAKEDIGLVIHGAFDSAMMYQSYADSVTEIFAFVEDKIIEKIGRLTTIDKDVSDREKRIIELNGQISEKEKHLMELEVKEKEKGNQPSTGNEVVEINANGEPDGGNK